MTRTAETAKGRDLIAMITNHGYPCPRPPIGNAPDTGGQVVYVNDLAMAMEDDGYSVVIFCRGGFPQFDDTRLRMGEEAFSEHVTYVYLPGGGNEFLPKEDISLALDEEIEALYQFVNQVARELERKPWEVFEFISSHYWDAAVIGYKLIERWQGDLFFERIRAAFHGKIAADLIDRYFEERHTRAIRHNWYYLLGSLLLESAQQTVPVNASQGQMLDACAKALRIAGDGISKYEKRLKVRIEHARWPGFTVNHSTVAAIFAGRTIAEYLSDRNLFRSEDLYRINRHFWTPHSLGPVKELNYHARPAEDKRQLKFAERRHHERVICERTPILISTSEEISRCLVSYYNVHPDRILYFPPCVNNQFKPRPRSACGRGYAYLAEKSGIPAKTLRKNRIVLEISRADRTKRKDLVLGGFLSACGQLDDTVLFVIGGPENEILQELRETIAAHPHLANRAFAIPDSVPFDVLVELFSLAHLYVSASEMEGFGMSVLQAAASGVPVVSSRFVPYVTSYLKDCTPIVEQQEPDAYAQAIAAVLSDLKAYSALKKKVLEVSRDFSWKTRLQDLKAQSKELVIVFNEGELDEYSVRLGEQRDVGELISLD